MASSRLGIPTLISSWERISFCAWRTVHFRYMY